MRERLAGVAFGFVALTTRQPGMLSRGAARSKPEVCARSVTHGNRHGVRGGQHERPHCKA
jgi:hypothetical protein